MENIDKYYELVSDRLRLGKLRIEDVEDMYEYGSDEEVAKYVMWNRYESVNDGKSFIEIILNKEPTFLKTGWHFCDHAINSN